MSRCSNSTACHHDPACEDLDCPGRPDAPAPRRIVKLQVNSSGAWRNVLDFDVQDEAEVLHLAASLFAWDTAADRISLRAIVPGDTAPLMNWTRERGWREWKAVA
jgi:hypothetical protein